MVASLLLSSVLTLVQLNCENLFDCRHDSLKNDLEWLEGGKRRWTPKRYWRKLNNIAKELVACGDGTPPDLVALCEVENDSVVRDLSQRTALGRIGYGYIVTSSPDLRGIDVALLYHPYSFSPLSHASLRVQPVDGMRPTRDILYVKGCTASADTLHVFVVHTPSRYGGERITRPHRLAVARRLTAATDSILGEDGKAKLVVLGDFNAYTGEASISHITARGLADVSSKATGTHGAKGTYCYKGRWGSIDHAFASAALLPHWLSTSIFDAPFLLEEDKKYGTEKPLRTYNGYRYQAAGFSDHLPLVVRLAF